MERQPRAWHVGANPLPLAACPRQPVSDALLVMQSTPKKKKKKRAVESKLLPRMWEQLHRPRSLPVVPTTMAHPKHFLLFVDLFNQTMHSRG